MMMQQHQKANALKQQQQQQMHHLELAYKAGLLPRSTDMRIFTYGIETTQTAQYRDYLQKYAQTKFALQKLRAQFPYKNNQVQQNPRNHSMIAAFNEHIQSMKSYDNNLNTLEVRSSAVIAKIAIAELLLTFSWFFLTIDFFTIQ